MENKRKTRSGIVVSNRMDKTVVVVVEKPWRHPLYQKVIRRKVRYKAHDKDNQCEMGDVVKIEETRPLSRLKRWRVVEIVTKAEPIGVQPKEIS
jgi:small subunit ribosomal protein S17